jgi:hypothetical protein
VFLQEIVHCQRLSLGPNFVAFVGDRYGSRPPAVSIPSVDFYTILSYAANDDDTKLIKDWYRCDENVVPSVFLLQSGTSGELECDDEQRRAQARKQYNDAQQNMMRAMTDAVQV